MKKVFLAVLVAGLFVACGNKNTEAEATDSTAVETEVVEEAVVEEDTTATAEVAEATTETAEAPAQAAPAKKEKANKVAEDIKAGGEAAATVIGAVKEDKKSTSNRGNR